jgi:hypothetical protein
VPEFNLEEQSRQFRKDGNGVGSAGRYQFESVRLGIAGVRPARAPLFQLRPGRRSGLRPARIRPDPARLRLGGGAAKLARPRSLSAAHRRGCAILASNHAWLDFRVSERPLHTPASVRSTSRSCARQAA